MKNGNKYYIVTKGSDDGTFERGDHIMIYPNGDIGCLEAGGFIEKEDVHNATIGMEYIPDGKRVSRSEKNLFGEFYRELHKTVGEYKHWRYGQAVFNTMFRLYPDAAQKYCGTVHDPFNNDCACIGFIDKCFEDILNEKY